MLLALSVISQNASVLGANGYKVFDERGGTIGRISGNDWILPDPDKFVSSRHATIQCDNGQFFLRDTSTNGTFINSPDQPAARDRPVSLSDGDRLFIGEYEILVQLIEEAPAPAPVSVSPVSVSPVSVSPVSVSPVSVSPVSVSPVSVSPVSVSPVSVSPVSVSPVSVSPVSVSPVSEAPGISDPLAALGDPFAPSPPAGPAPSPPGAPAIPSDYQITGYRTPAAAAAPAPAPAATAYGAPPPARPSPPAAVHPAARHSVASASPLAPVPPVAPTAPPMRPAPAAAQPPPDGAMELLAAMGLDPSHVDPGVYRQLGTIVRMVVQGLIDVLQSRAEIKNNFRMPMTSIRPVENNPLKFSMNADDALHNLFIKRNPGYLGPVESFHEAFQDVAFHQLAMLAGVRAAYDAMLAKLHPDRLEEIYERKLKRTTLLALGRQSKFWDLYREQFEDIDRDVEAHFQMLFGEEFARAYNDQLQRLNAAARARQR